MHTALRQHARADVGRRRAARAGPGPCRPRRTARAGPGRPTSAPSSPRAGAQRELLARRAHHVPSRAELDPRDLVARRGAGPRAPRPPSQRDLVLGRAPAGRGRRPSRRRPRVAAVAGVVVPPSGLSVGVELPDDDRHRRALLGLLPPAGSCSMTMPSSSGASTSLALRSTSKPAARQRRDRRRLRPRRSRRAPSTSLRLLGDRERDRRALASICAPPPGLCASTVPGSSSSVSCSVRVTLKPAPASVELRLVVALADDVRAPRPARLAAGDDERHRRALVDLLCPSGGPCRDRRGPSRRCRSSPRARRTSKPGLLQAPARRVTRQAARRAARRPARAAGHGERRPSSPSSAFVPPAGPGR